MSGSYNWFPDSLICKLYNKLSVFCPVSVTLRSVQDFYPASAGVIKKIVAILFCREYFFLRHFN
jgi:hypothetical protein